MYKALLAGCEIGTEATRASIIEKAINLNYISFKNNAYSIEEKGFKLIELLKQVELDLSVKRTIELNMQLKKVYTKEMSRNECIEHAKKFLNEYFNKETTIEKNEFKENHQNEIIGKCPWCNKDIIAVKSKKGKMYVHAERQNECEFVLFESIKHFRDTVTLTDAKVSKLLKGSPVSLKKKSKEGKEYQVNLFLETFPTEYNGKKYPKFKEEYKNQK